MRLSPSAPARRTEADGIHDGRANELERHRHGDVGEAELTEQIAHDLAFIFFQQTVFIVLGMALEIDHSKLIRADCHMHATQLALGQNGQAGGLQLFPVDFIVT